MEGGKTWEAIRQFSLFRSLTLSITHYFPLSTEPLARTVCMSTWFQSTLFKKLCVFFLLNERNENYDGLISPPLSCFSGSSQADDCLHNEQYFDPWMRQAVYNTERHICMGVTLPGSLSYLFCLSGFAGMCICRVKTVTKDVFLYWPSRRWSINR